MIPPFQQELLLLCFRSLEDSVIAQQLLQEDMIKEEFQRSETQRNDEVCLSLSLFHTSPLSLFTSAGFISKLVRLYYSRK